MAADARVKVTLRCEECKQRNYFTVKNWNVESTARSAANTQSTLKPSDLTKGL